MSGPDLRFGTWYTLEPPSQSPVPAWPVPYGLVLPRLLTQGLPPLFSLHTDLLALELLHCSLIFLGDMRPAPQGALPRLTLPQQPPRSSCAPGGGQAYVGLACNPHVSLLTTSQQASPEGGASCPQHLLYHRHPCAPGRPPRTCTHLDLRLLLQLQRLFLHLCQVQGLLGVPCGGARVLGPSAWRACQGAASETTAAQPQSTCATLTPGQTLPDDSSLQRLLSPSRHLCLLISDRKPLPSPVRGLTPIRDYHSPRAPSERLSLAH